MKNKILRNASWIIICKIGQSVLSLLVTMITARYLGPTNYGVINYAAAVVAFVAPVVQLGFGNIQVLTLVERPDEEGKVVGTTLLSSIVMALVGICGIVAFSMIANRNDFQTIVVCALYSFVLLLQGAELIQYWFQKKYLSKYYSIISLSAFAVVSAYKVYLLTNGTSIAWFAISNSIDYALILAASIIVYRKLGGQKLSFSRRLAFEMLEKSKHYILANLMIVIFTQTDRVMLQLMLNSEATGFYSAAATCSGMFNFIFAAIIDSARPTIFENLKKSHKSFEESVSMLYSVIIYLSLLICILVTIFSGLIVHIIYGVQYDPSIMTLRIAVWFIPFSFIGSVRNVWLLAENKQRWLPMINLSGAILNVIMNLVLIPLMGINGAAIASLLTQIFANVIVSYLIKETRENTCLMIEGFNPKHLVRLIKQVKK